MNSDQKRGRSARKEQTPQRVQQAAQSMNSAYSDGMQRGYVPQNTGGYRLTGSPPKLGNTGAYYASSVTGSQRGFAPGRNETARHQDKKAHRNTGIIAVIITLVLCAAGVGAYFGLIKPENEKRAEAEAEKNRQNDIAQAVSAYNDVFCPGIYVNGISLEGLTGDQAMAVFQEKIQNQNSWYVTLTYEGKEATIRAADLEMTVDTARIQQALIAAWEPGHNVDGRKSNEQRLAEIKQLQTSPQSYTFDVFDPEKTKARISTLLSSIKTSVDRSPQNAQMLYFDPSLDYPFVFQDEVYGLSLDTAALGDQIYNMASSLQSGTVEVQPQLIAPEVKKTDLQKHYMLRSTATTPIDKHSTDNRNNNIRRAFEAINGYELKKGKEFNFNQVVGKRTIANGFYEAEEYVYGEHQPGVGGGVCQASTTVYQAAVCAGLKIDKRKPHSDSVSYTDYGKDATVYWFETDKKPRTDLIFTNNTEGTIYIVARVETDPSNKKRLICKVCMYGEDMGDVRYELDAEIVDVLPPPVEEEIVDSEEKVRKAKDGYVVKSYRLKYEANVLTERKELYTDTYKPQAARVLRSN